MAAYEDCRQENRQVREKRIGLHRIDLGSVEETVGRREDWY